MNQKPRIKCMKTQKTSIHIHSKGAYDKKWQNIKLIVKCKANNYETIETTASKKTYYSQSSKKSRSSSLKSLFYQSKKLNQDQTFRKKSHHSFFKLPNNNFTHKPQQIQGEDKDKQIKTKLFDKIQKTTKKIILQLNQPQYEPLPKSNKHLQSKHKIFDVKIDQKMQNIASGSLYNIQSLTNQLCDSSVNYLQKEQCISKNYNSEQLKQNKRDVKVKEIDVQTDWVEINQKISDKHFILLRSQKDSKLQKEKIKHQEKNNQIKLAHEVAKEEFHKIDQQQIQEIRLTTSKKQTQTKVEQEKKIKLHDDLKQELKKDKILLDTLLPLGLVAGYCSKMMKKSKLNWYLPAVLLYKEIYRYFKDSEEINYRGHQQGIITKESLTMLLQQNNHLKLNLQKIIQSSIKKQKIPQKYVNLIKPQQKQPLSLYIYEQVVNITNEYLKSEQKNDSNTAICILRMLQSVCILMKMNGIKKIPRVKNIEELEPNQVEELIPELLGIISQKIQIL